MQHTPKLKVSFRLFVLNLVGALLIAAGIYCWSGEGLPSNTVAKAAGAALMVVGFVLVAVFMTDLFRRIRALQGAPKQYDGNQG